jgi:hypothetical protein
MGRACGTCGRKVNIEFWWGGLREKEHLEALGVGRMIILN